jgi:hypothetical protein
MNIFKEFFRAEGPPPPVLEKLSHYEKGFLVSFHPRATEIYGPALAMSSTTLPCRNIYISPRIRHSFVLTICLNCFCYLFIKLEWLSGTLNLDYYVTRQKTKFHLSWTCDANLTCTDSIKESSETD